MEVSIEKIALEVFESNKLIQKIIGKPSFEIVERIKEIEQFRSIFGSYLQERPFIF